MQPYCNWVKGVSLGCPMAPGNHIPLRRDCYHLTQYADIFLSCPGPRTPFFSLSHRGTAKILLLAWQFGIRLPIGPETSRDASTYTPLANARQHAETHHKKRAFVAPGRISGSLAGRFCCRGGSCAAVFLFCVVEFRVRRIVQGSPESASTEILRRFPHEGCRTDMVAASARVV